MFVVVHERDELVREAVMENKVKSLMLRSQKLPGVGVVAFIGLLTALLPSCAKETQEGDTEPSVQGALAVAPSLGTAESFAVLGASTVTNTGPTIVTGDLGVSPGTAVTGFPPGIVVGGTIHSADAVAAQAQNDTTTAYVNLAGQACDTTFGVPTDLVGLTLVPGVYCFASSASLTGQLTLDAGGDPNAVWVFKVGSTLITGSNASVLMTNGGQQCNVFWQVGSSATLGTGTSFVGNILALTSITLNTNASLSGRALAQNGAVTMDSNAVAISTCAVPAIAPTLGKAFSPATIAAGGTSTLTVTLSNASGTPATLTAPFTDTLPSGVVTAGSGSTTCGGTVTTGTSTVTLTGGAVPANGSCTLSVPVTAPNGGIFINSLAVGALQTSNGSNAAPAVATLTVPQPPNAPTVGKAFSPAVINAGGGSTLTITLNNTSGSAATLTSPLTDTLPTGVVTAGAGATTCGGTVTTSASTVTLTGGAIPANGSCTVTVPVTAPNGGNFINSLAAGALQTSNGGNAAPAIATLTVNAAVVAPTLAKAFSPATIAAGGASNLTITLSNANGTAANLTAPLTDTLPSGVVVDGAGSTTCGGTVTVGTSTVTLTGGAIPANGSCTVTVPVTAPNGGSFINAIPAGALQTSNGSNAAPAIATLTVTAPTAVTLGKAFAPAVINAGGTSTLTITLSNTNGTAANLTAPLTDTLPSGVLIAGGGTTTCGGTVTTGISTVTLTGGAIPANGSCTVTVPVTAPGGGSFVNALGSGALQTNLGSNIAPAIATLTVNAAVVPPTLGKAFTPATIAAGGASTLTITLSNSNGTAASLTQPLTDTLPTGVVVTGAGSTTCGGTVTNSTSTVTLTGGSIPANGSCTVTVPVTAPTGGSFINSLGVGALQTNLGSNTAPAIATLTVTAPTAVTLGKAFAPAVINAGGTSTLTITLSNTNSTPANLTEPLTDTLPAGVVTAGAATTTCGGTAVVGTSTVTLTGGAIPANGSCIVTVPVTAPNGGTFVNALPAGALQTDKGANAAPVIATLTVITPVVTPTLAKTFSPATINEGGTSTLTITLTNPNAAPANLTAPLVDQLPSGVTVVGNANNTCGGTVTATPGSSTVTLNGGAIPANGSCIVAVDVTAQQNGTYVNKLPAGALQTDKGNNAGSATAILTVRRETAPTLAKAFSPASILEGGTSTLTITLSNTNNTPANLTAPLVDQLPNGVTVVGNANNTCGGTVTATPGSSTVTLNGGAIPANGFCTVTVDVTATDKGSYFNKLDRGALQTDQGSNAAPAVATLTVKPRENPTW
jgi:uncharacterized repeat protein (TIGR01451 family)